MMQDRESLVSRFFSRAKTMTERKERQPQAKTIFEQKEEQEEQQLEEVLSFLGNNYSAEPSGAVTYLVKGGERISGGYHTYSLKDGVVYGKLGAREEVVIDKNGTVLQSSHDLERVQKRRELREVREFLEDNNNYSILGDTYSLKDSGAMVCIMSSRGVPVAEYHSYRLKDGEIYGTLGAREEVVINKLGKVLKSSHEFEREEEQQELRDVLAFLGNNYYAEKKGAITYLINRSGKQVVGYHRYYLKDGVVYGRLGATEEPLSL